MLEDGISSHVFRDTRWCTVYVLLHSVLVVVWVTLCNLENNSTVHACADETCGGERKRKGNVRAGALSSLSVLFIPPSHLAVNDKYMVKTGDQVLRRASVRRYPPRHREECWKRCED